MNLIHSCIVLLFLFVVLVVEVVSCRLLGEAQVGGEIVDEVTQCLLFLMQSSLCTEEVALGDVEGRVVILLDGEWVGRRTWHIHHSKQICEWEKEKNYTKCTLTNLEDGSMITEMCNKEIAQLVPILVGFHTYTNKAFGWSLVRMVAQNFMQLLVRLNDVEKDSQICKCNKKTNSNWLYTETHTRTGKWGCATKNELNMWNPRKMILLHKTRETLA